MRRQLSKTERINRPAALDGKPADSVWGFLYIAETKAPELRLLFDVIVTYQG
jgi:hypothetical protein